MPITSRYTDLEDVDFSIENLPERLAPLFLHAKEWSLSDSGEIEKLAATKKEEELSEFIDLFFPLQDEIELFVQAGQQEAPVPDAVVVMELSYEAYDVLLSMGYKPSCFTGTP